MKTTLYRDKVSQRGKTALQCDHETAIVHREHPVGISDNFSFLDGFRKFWYIIIFIFGTSGLK